MTMHVGSQATYLEEEFGMPTPHGSAEMRGVASETKNLPLIAITSISEAPQTVHATCIGESPADPGASIEVPAHGTAVIHACTWDTLRDDSFGLATALQKTSGDTPRNHAITLTTDSVPGAFYAFGFALNGSVTQAQLQPLDFYDPGLLASTKIVYVGVPVGSESRLLKGSFSPFLTLANFSSQTRTTEVLLADSSSGTPKVQEVAQVNCSALSTKTVKLPAQSGIGIRNTYTIQSDGKPGDVQAHLFANRDTADDRLELLAKDSGDNHNGGDHPWSIENGNTSTLLLYNSTSKQQEFSVRISGDGAAWNQVFHLAPSETRAVSINDIIAGQIPDITKTRLPPSLTHGDVLWFTEFGASGLGRLLVVNEQAGLKRSFSCPKTNNLCGASLGPTSYVDFPDGGFGSISAINVVICGEYDANSCSQTNPQSGYFSYTTQWQNANNGITQMSGSTNSSLTLQGLKPGSFSVTAVASYGSCSSSPIGGGGNVVACPSTVSVSTLDQMALSSVFPTDKTGVGALAEMCVSGSNPPYNQAQIQETVTLSSNGCAVYVNPVSSPTNLSFTVGASTVGEDGIFRTSKTNVFYDHHHAVNTSSVLPAGVSCNIVYKQQYSCSGSNIGPVFTITYQLQAGSLNGTPVTNVTVQKQ